jgi:hypothetical protein
LQGPGQKYIRKVIEENMENYAVITADIIDSQKQPEQLTQLKTKPEPFDSAGLLTGFTFSRGDEIQAVSMELELLPVIIRKLRYRCIPLKLRIAVGIGPIERAGKTYTSSWDMNGAAFFKARAALNRLDAVNRKVPGTFFASPDPGFDLAVNTIYSLYDTIINHWTEKQWITVHGYEANVTLVKAAAVFNVTWQNIQKICKAAEWDRIQAAEANLAMMLAGNFNTGNSGW